MGFSNHTSHEKCTSVNKGNVLGLCLLWAEYRQVCDLRMTSRGSAFAADRRIVTHPRGKTAGAANSALTAIPCPVRNEWSYTYIPYTI